MLGGGVEPRYINVTKWGSFSLKVLLDFLLDFSGVIRQARLAPSENQNPGRIFEHRELEAIYLLSSVAFTREELLIGLQSVEDSETWDFWGERSSRLAWAKFLFFSFFPFLPQPALCTTFTISVLRLEFQQRKADDT